MPKARFRSYSPIGAVLGSKHSRGKKQSRSGSKVFCVICTLEGRHPAISSDGLIHDSLAKDRCHGKRSPDSLIEGLWPHHSKVLTMPALACGFPAFLQAG